MIRSMRWGMMILLLVIAVATWCAPERRDPYVAYLYPAGGQQGGVVRVLAGGQRLRGITGAVVTGGGIRVSVVSYVGPMGPLNKLQQDELKRRIQAIIDQRVPGRDKKAPAQQPADKAPPKPVTLPDLPELRNLEEKTPAQLRELTQRFLNPKKRPKPPMAEEATLEVTIDPAAAPGDRELRLRTPAGLSNPILFQVSNTPEQREPEKEEPATDIQPFNAPVVLNGRIMPGQVDRYPLQLHAGQRLVATAQARKLIPYLADAVPGWFQAVLALYDASGKEMAFADDNEFDPDPTLGYMVPQDGAYRLEIRDAIYRERQDFVYRIEVTEQPQANPAPSGRHTANLSTLAALLPPGIELPRSKEAEPNDMVSQTKPLALPRVVSGGIATPGDVDVFQFTGRAGEEVVVEVYARRLGAPMDALVRLLDASGHVCAWNDDSPDKRMGLLTHHADAYLTAKLPATGAYFVQVSEAQRHGGEAYRYAVRISPRLPDFTLRMTPASINVPVGFAAELTVYAFRKDGWDGDIDIAVKDAPLGFALQGARIPAGRESVRMTLTAPQLTRFRAANEPVSLTLEGRAQIDDKTITRPVIPAEQQMQAFAYTQLVPAQQCVVLVNRGQRNAPVITLATTGRLRLPAGGDAEVTYTIHPMPQIPLHFALSDPPAGVTLKETKTTPAGVTLVLSADDKHIGYADNLIIEVSSELEGKGQQGATARKQRVSVVLPAVPFEIVKGK